jgi:N-formylglutamate amidohydrolase
MMTCPLVRRPAAGTRAPIVVSVPHLGTEPLPDVAPGDYREPRFETFPYGFADTCAGDLYGDLHAHGATVVATPLSRMFVDVNRRRDDFEHVDGEVQSRRGVVRTHTMREVPIFARPLTLAALEARLRAFWDPYYATLDGLLADLRRAHGAVVLLDGHTGSPRRMNGHQVIIGTCRGATCAPGVAAGVGALFRRHGFEVHDNVSGYTGGNIVATRGRPEASGIHAIQVEVNASLLVAHTGEELIARITRGERPEKAEANIARVRACLREVLAALPSMLDALDGRAARRPSAAGGGSG